GIIPDMNWTSAAVYGWRTLSACTRTNVALSGTTTGRVGTMSGVVEVVAPPGAQPTSTAAAAARSCMTLRGLRSESISYPSVGCLTSNNTRSGRERQVVRTAVVPEYVCASGSPGRRATTHESADDHSRHARRMRRGSAAFGKSDAARRAYWRAPAHRPRPT